VVPDDAARPDERGIPRRAVHDRAVLDRRPRPHHDRPVIAAQHRARPHRRLRAEGHPPDHDRVGVNVSIRIDFGYVVRKSVDMHTETVSFMLVADDEQGAGPRINELLACAVSGISGTERPGQTLMAQTVWAAMETESHLAVQAGTGTGKSLAYLVPA